MTNLQKAQSRAKMYRCIREFFESNEYLEVETPQFVASPDTEPTLSHFETEARLLDGRKLRGAMITSPEFALKKLVGVDMPRIFEITKVFRNDEPPSPLHSPEFTMLEWYKYGSSFREGIEETKRLVDSVAEVFDYELGEWEEVSVEELFRTHCGIESLENPSIELYRSALTSNSLDFEPDDTISDLFHRLFLNLVEPELSKRSNPVIVTHYPRHEAALSRIDEDGMAERFEIYIKGIEICNAFGEPRRTISRNTGRFSL